MVTPKKHMKWSALVAGLWMLGSGGLSYNFAIYSSKLKDALGYSQAKTNLLGTAKDIGDNVGLIAGFLSATLPPWALLLIGAVQNTLGYLAIYLIASQKVEKPPFWQVFFSMWLGVNGSTFFNTAALVTCVGSFPNSRGVVVGLLKAMVGLSGAIYAQIYSALLAPNQIAFLLVVAVGPSLIALIAMPLLRPVITDPASRTPEIEEEENDNLQFLFFLFLILACYLMVEIIVSAFFPFSKSQNQLVAVGMVVIVSFTFLVPLKSFLNSGNLRQESQLLSHAEEKTEIMVHQALITESQITPGEFEVVNLEDISSSAVSSVSSEEVELLKPYVRPRRGENFTLSEGIIKADFWLFFLAILCSAGSGLTAMNNLAQLGEAHGDGDIKIAVSLVSVWNYLGRILGGFYSEHLVRHYGLPRPSILIGVHSLMVIGHLMFAFATPGAMYLGSLIVGSGFGTTMAMIPAISSELFGLKNFGIFYNVFTSALPIGSYLFSGLLAGYIYDREAAKEASGGGKGVGFSEINLSLLNSTRERNMGLPLDSSDGIACHGAHCFKFTFIVMAAVCVVASLADFWLVVRTHPVYRRLYPRKKSIEVVEESSSSMCSTDILS